LQFEKAHRLRLHFRFKGKVAQCAHIKCQGALCAGCRRWRVRSSVP
jgi:hypothetical protein